MTEDEARAEAFKRSNGFFEFSGPFSGASKGRDASLVYPRTKLWMIIRCGDLLPDLYPDCNDEFWVYFVDGFYLRNNITIEFDDGGNPQAYPNITKTWGGHHLQYSFIPDKPNIELWVEDNLDEDVRDEYAIVIHEGNEYHRMYYFDEGYETAHGNSQAVENRWRQQFADPDRIWTQGQEPLDVCRENSDNTGNGG